MNRWKSRLLGAAGVRSAPQARASRRAWGYVCSVPSGAFPRRIRNLQAPTGRRLLSVGFQPYVTGENTTRAVSARLRERPCGRATYFQSRSYRAHFFCMVFVGLRERVRLPYANQFRPFGARGRKRSREPGFSGAERRSRFFCFPRRRKPYFIYGNGQPHHESEPCQISSTVRSSTR